jgi:hypothetical protein
MVNDFDLDDVVIDRMLMALAFDGGIIGANRWINLLEEVLWDRGMPVDPLCR